MFYALPSKYVEVNVSISVSVVCQGVYICQPLGAHMEVKLVLLGGRRG